MGISTGYNSLVMADRIVVLPFGKAIRVRRERARLSQGGLADRLDLGIDQSTVSKWESRQTAMRHYEPLQALARVLDAPIDDIIEGRVPAEWVGALRENGAVYGDDLTQQLEAQVGPLSDLQKNIVVDIHDLNEEAQEEVHKLIRLLLVGHRINPDPPNQTDSTRRAGGL